tara:strand:+ start:83 stop:259 length:177 start_codon:yes stop_codon:yes gene_type:complete
MVMREVKFPHDKNKEIMERDLRIILTDILDTLKEILKLQKKDTTDNKDVSKEKQLLND